MKRIKIIHCLVLISGMLLFQQCKKNNNDEPVTGKLEGMVKDAVNATPLAGAQVIVFNADQNAPVGQTLTTNTLGEYSTQLVPGNYYVKLYKQGYDAVPPQSMEAVPFSIAASQSTRQDAEMFPVSSSSTGWIEGKVMAGTTPIKGALVVAADSERGVAFSSISAENGEYHIYNVPGGSYSVRVFIRSYQSEIKSANVVAQAGSTGLNFSLQQSTGASLAGNVRNLAISNLDVDISLVHPLTKETIPGLTTRSANQSYTISGIPAGDYIARATYRNDLRVMDPDRIAKFGEPVVSVSGTVANPSTLSFDITGTVVLSTPTNPITTTKPVIVSSTRPTFSWNAYSSTSDYVVEVVDAATGLVVWGGFNRVAGLPVKKMVIPSSTTSITYNSDGLATTADLVKGKIYRWRVYASKNDVNSPTGWTLISVSEDQVGLIQVAR